MKLALFDLDHTLLNGDSDALWCEFLMDERVLDRTEFEKQNKEVMQRYADASIEPDAFCNFYAATLGGRTLVEWRPWLDRFLNEVVLPKIPEAAYALVDSHRSRGDRLVMTTATNRVLTELTARHMRIDDLIATEVEVVNGRCSGRTRGVLNMREGKVERMMMWLASQDLTAAALADAVFYSDSSNDLPLLKTVGHPVAVDPDESLRRHAMDAGWPVMELFRE